MLKKRNFLGKWTSVILALIICMNVSVIVNAETVAEVVTPETSTSKTVNVSQVSTTAVTFGYSVTLKAMAKGLDTAKCKYAFYYKYEDESWTTIQGYSKTDTVNWTPEQIGHYEVCIKISCNAKVYKKYFNIVASEELINLSVISSSHIKTGDMVTLTAKATGGLDGHTFAYYSKSLYSDWWTILNDYKEADSMQWKPSESGEYDICIKVKDGVGQISEKYFTLTVENEGIKTPSTFLLTVKAPISAPYQWSYDISNQEVIALTDKTERNDMDFTDPSLLLDYRFKTVKAGVTKLTMKYTAYNGKVYKMTYDITVDKNLNYTVENSEGTYFDAEIPEIKRVDRAFSLNLPEASDGYRWKCDISNPNVVEFFDTEERYDGEEYQFRAVRKGFTNITLSCISPSDTDIRYQLIYDISIDDELNIMVDDYDGYYIENWNLPEIKIDT